MSALGHITTRELVQEAARRRYEEIRLPRNATAGRDVIERRAYRLAKQYIDTHGGKVFGSGVHRWARNQCRISKAQATDILRRLLSETGYYDRLTDRVTAEVHAKRAAATQEAAR